MSPVSTCWIDPLSTVASVLDLDFDKSNAEFVRFYDRLVQPLAAAGVAVVMLENIGHAIEARGRAKGASAKADRPDLTFIVQAPRESRGARVDRGQGADRPRCVQARRPWTFDRDTQRVSRQASAADGGGTVAPNRPDGEGKPPAWSENSPLGRNEIRSAVTSKAELHRRRRQGARPRRGSRDGRRGWPEASAPSPSALSGTGSHRGSQPGPGPGRGTGSHQSHPRRGGRGGRARV